MAGVAPGPVLLQPGEGGLIMHLEKLNPATGAKAVAGSIAFLAGCNSDHIITTLALKRIYSRVAVSQNVALVIAAHAGLLREVRN